MSTYLKTCRRICDPVSYIAGLLLLISVLFSSPAADSVFAADTGYTNPETGYTILLEDDADLLTAAEENALLAEMEKITEFGNAAFKSIAFNNMSSTANYAREYYHSHFGSNSGTLFLIDMFYRTLYIFSDGAIYRVVTTGRAETITDNIYRMASRAEYFACANEAYSEIYTLLIGNQIAQPMKYISNALLAILLALLANFVLINNVSKLRRADINRMIHAASVSFRFTDPEVNYTSTTKTYSPVERSSGGGGGSSGGGGGGGHSSGGGGGHKF